MSFRVVPVPCLSDNYAYLIVCSRTNLAALVDPGEPGPMLEAIAREGVTLAAIWATHHHPDHIGGIEGVCSDPAIGPVDVVASEQDRDRVPRASVIVKDGDVVPLGELRARVIHNPGHTLGAISYYLEGSPGAVFTGDTMFAAGCGRLFEGTAEMMHASLQKLAGLPEDTQVFFGHEYTASNLKFAAAAEPANADVVRRAGALAARTTPSTIGLERATNPFVRAKDVEELAKRRSWKDTFR
jgi:hydroxyacylglutathione hydrolase